jgi:hypothetical protein
LNSEYKKACLEEKIIFMERELINDYEKEEWKFYNEYLK